MIQILLILLIVAALSVGVDPIQKRYPDQWSKLLWTAFVVYLLGNLYFTLFSRIVGSGTYVDPRPFGTYLRAFEAIDTSIGNATGFAGFFLNDISPYAALILNILLYYPMGYLLAILFPNLKAWQVVLIGCCASIATEFTQYLLKMGWCELDDIIVNTLGTAIGLWVRRLQVRYISSRM